MAKATEAQIRQLENVHKQALSNILQAIAFRYLIYQKFGSDSQQWKRYAALVTRLGNSWFDRQMKLEAGGAIKEGINRNDLFTYQGNQKLRDLVKRWDSKGEGIGIIPIIAWAIVALVGFFTADQIVDELNTTTQEQGELIQTTQEYCKLYNLNAEECKKILIEQNKAVNPPDSGGLGTTLAKWGIGLGIAFILFKNSDKLFTKKSN